MVFPSLFAWGQIYVEWSADNEMVPYADKAHTATNTTYRME